MTDWLKTPETAKFLEENLGNDRIFSVGQSTNWYRIYNDVSHGWRSETVQKLLATRAILDPNTNIIYNIASADGYAGATTQNYDLIETLISAGINEETQQISIAPNSLNLLSLLDVKYLISTKPIISDKLNSVFERWDENSQTTYRIYENKKNPGRIFAIKNLLLIKSSKQLQLTMTDSSFSPEETALTISDLHKTKFNNNVEISSIHIENQKLNFNVKATDESFIVIADSFYPGWKAKIDGVNTQIFPANINSRGIITPTGEHKISLSFQPKSLKIGAAISLLTNIILVIGFFYFLIKEKFIKQSETKP